MAFERFTPEERKYVICNHNLNVLIKAPFGVLTAFSNNPIPFFTSQSNSQESSASLYNVFLCSETKLKSCATETVSTVIQTEPESFNPQLDTQMTKCLWETEFAIADFEQQNKALLKELNYLKVSLRCSNRSQANAKLNDDQAESELEISEGVTSEKNKEKRQKLDEATSKAESLQFELLESN